MRMPLHRAVGYAGVVAGLLLVFDTATFLGTQWSPLHVPMYADNELSLAYWLLAIGAAFLFWPVFWRMIRGLFASYAPGLDARVGDGFEHNSIELRRKKRLGLGRPAGLPDRGVLLGMPVMILLVLIVIWDLPLPSRGIHVSISRRDFERATVDWRQAALIVRVEGSDPTKPPVFKVQGKEVAPANLREALKRELSPRAEWIVFVEGDPKLSYESVVQVVDVVNGLHAKPVLLTPGVERIP